MKSFLVIVLVIVINTLLVLVIVLEFYSNYSYIVLVICHSGLYQALYMKVFKYKQVCTSECN